MKTATTTIQSWLTDHETWLAEHGWTYPGWPLRSAPLIARKLQNLPAKHNLVISDEGLWHFSGARSDTDRIAQLLSDFDVTVLVYFRRPDEFLEAWFKQGIKNGAGTRHIPAFLAAPAVRAMTLWARLDRFAGIFGKENLIIAPYEKAQFLGGSILSDFIARTGLPQPQAQPDADPGPPPGIHKNISPTADTILMAGLMRHVFGMDQAQIKALLDTSPTALPSGTRNSLLTAKEITEIRDEFRPVFARIQQHYGGGAAPDFFLDWGTAQDHAPVSPLRQAYDQYMVALGPT